MSVRSAGGSSDSIKRASIVSRGVLRCGRSRSYETLDYASGARPPGFLLMTLRDWALI